MFHTLQLKMTVNGSGFFSQVISQGNIHMCKTYLCPFKVMINLSLCKTIHSERKVILGDFVLNSQVGTGISMQMAISYVIDCRCASRVIVQML